VLELENQRNTLPIRRQFVAAYLRKASIYQPLNFEIEERAKQLRSQGLKNFDALHVATAEFTNADFFLTCDKRLINGSKSLTMKVRNPVEFILEITDEDP
jgi:predicted nucleic acid-binding protein